MIEKRRIALFGGTFDPVHLGHLHLASVAREGLMLDEVRFLPCRISPHKTGSRPTPAADRVEMLRRATADLPWAVVDEMELLREGPSFSYETAEEMHRRFPDARLFWIMGTDQWTALPRWKNPELLAGWVEFIVLARGETPEPREGYRLHVVKGEHPASATAIRSALAAGASHHPWLPDAVADWISRRGLYRAGADTNPSP